MILYVNNNSGVLFIKNIIFSISIVIKSCAWRVIELVSKAD